jgi:hypothetical protein
LLDQIEREKQGKVVMEKVRIEEELDRVREALAKAEREVEAERSAKRAEQEKYRQTWDAQQELNAVANEVQNLF